MNLMAFITRHPRYHPEDYELDHKLHWSKELWLSNIFRAHEWLFGRRFGIRAEAKSGPGYYIPISFEAKVVYLEVELRRTLREWLNFLLYPVVNPMPRLSIGLAIALDVVDAGTNTTTSPLSFSHTCTGSNLILFLTPTLNATTPVLNAPTYNSVAGTLIQVQTTWSSSFLFGLYYLINPATGSNTASVSFSGFTTPNANMAAISYSGVNQSSPIDASATGHAGTSSPFTQAVTVVGSTCWLIGLYFGNSSTAPTAFSHTSRISFINQPTVNDYANVQDSNGIVSSGSNTLSWTAGGNRSAITGASFLAASGGGGGSTSALGSKTLLGVGA